MANGSFLGQKTKITVVRKLKLDDVAREYGQIRPGTESGDFIPDCPFFQEGQEFIVVTGGDQDCKPAGFCDWAWADIWKDVLMVANTAGGVQDPVHGDGRLDLCQKNKRASPHICEDALL